MSSLSYKEKQQAHERAEQMAREADIRQLYEAGTTLQVLNQLYNAGEVGRVLKKIHDEKMLLELLDETPVLVSNRYKFNGNDPHEH
jgi:hypothetical protein